MWTNSGNNTLTFIFADELPRDLSSVGLEHRLDRAGVAGSNPVDPTRTNPSKRMGFCFYALF